MIPATALCAVLVASAFAASPAEWTAKARGQADAARYDDALASIDSALARDTAFIEAEVLRARIHSWQGNFASADEKLDALRARDPQNADILLAQASSRYYQGRLGESAAIFREVLAAHPGSAEAQDGLARVQRAQAALDGKTEAASGSRPWRVDAGMEYSTFSRRPQPDWNQQAIQVSRRLEAGKTTVYGRVERYHQFEMNDLAFAAGVAQALHPRANAQVEAGWTLTPDFKPVWRLAADAEFLAMHSSSSKLMPGAWLLAGLRYDAYKDVNIVGIHPGVRLEWKKPWALTLKASHVKEEGEGPLWGGSVRVDAPLGLPAVGALSGQRLWLGFADAPETVAAATVSTRTIFAGIGADVGRAWLFNAGYTRDDREDSWVRHAVGADIARRF
ncbi:MAG TPA: YaiO family outer membrane beta-barrel protein [Fibrobacteria bacterium]|nr:YaiO family outer membrane beta-barrel protein [Fibrobacteria bacterium]